MKSANYWRLALLFFLLSGVFVISSCRETVKVPLDYAAYRPLFDVDLSEYAGKTIYLMKVKNHARDTTMFAYYSKKHDIIYGNPAASWATGASGQSLESFFWYSFQKALLRAGVKVMAEYRPGSDAPGIKLVMHEINHDNYKFEVLLQREGAFVFSKMYDVAEPDVSDEEMTPEFLEGRAYGMITKVIEKILTDEEFKTALFVG